MECVKRFYRINIIRLYSVVFILSLIACGKNNKTGKEKVLSDTENREVILAESFNNLVVVDSLGVTGSDGVISFPLTNGSSIFMMGDSFLKPVKDGKRDPKSKMINNAFIVVNNPLGTSKSIFNGTLDDPETMLVPKNKGDIKEYYWPGHGFELNNELHIFMSRFTHDTDDTWGFEYTGTDYLKLEKGTFKVVSQDNFPYSMLNGVHYGHAIINEDTYTYIYGSKPLKEQAKLHVARAKIDNKINELTDYEFYNGKAWVENPKESQALKGIGKEVPEQFTVFKYDDKYVLIIQERDLTSGNIYSYRSNTPTGPWTNEKLLYHTVDQEIQPDDKVFTYNAMAHPQYIKDDKLLISYCVNSFIVPKIHEHVNYYRPKFIWVPMEMILN